MEKASLTRKSYNDRRTYNRRMVGAVAGEMRPGKWTKEDRRSSSIDHSVEERSSLSCSSFYTFFSFLVFVLGVVVEVGFLVVAR